MSESGRIFRIIKRICFWPGTGVAIAVIFLGFYLIIWWFYSAFMESISFRNEAQEVACITANSIKAGIRMVSGSSDGAMFALESMFWIFVYVIVMIYFAESKNEKMSLKYVIPPGLFSLAICAIAGLAMFGGVSP